MQAHGSQEPHDVGRTLAVVGLAAGSLAALALCLSDRAPGLVRRTVLRFELGDEAQAMSLGFDPYLVGHFAIWFSLAFLAGLALARRPLFVAPAAVVLVGAGIAIEEAQRRFTAVRGFQLTDIAANTLGVAAGSVLALAVIGGHRLVVQQRS